MKILIAGEEPGMDAEDRALITRYVRIGRRPTTFRVEGSTWNLLYKIAGEQKTTVGKLCTEIAEVIAEDLDLAVAIRIYVLGYFGGRIPEEYLADEVRQFLSSLSNVQ